MRILVTGAAGFIGSNLVERLLSSGHLVTGIDNFDPYYSPIVKKTNLVSSLRSENFQFKPLDIRNWTEMKREIDGRYDAIVHLAAKAGVRGSIDSPREYQQTNVEGTQNVLELAKRRGTSQFIFASSSSVYGINSNVPWSEDDHVLSPISPYASTKISGELLGHVYSHLYGIRFLALRFFTAYGPRQRPDLAIHKFAELIKAGLPVPIFGDGKTLRDYTYVTDIVAGIISALTYTGSQYEVFNIGSGRPVALIDLVRQLGEALGKEPILKFLEDQPGDVPQTWADIARASAKLGYRPNTPLSSGLRMFAKWLAAEVQKEGGARVLSLSDHGGVCA